MRAARTTRLRVTATVAALLTALASAPVAVLIANSHGVAVPGILSAERLMAMLDARSPGERVKGELTASKVERDRSRARVLGKVFPPTPSPSEQLARLIVPTQPPAPLPTIPIVPPTAADVIAPSTLFASAGPPIGGGGALIGGVVGGGSGPGGSVGGGSGPGGGGSGTPPGNSSGTPPVSSAVPEPGSWLMMLVGFAMVGSAMPRRRARRAPAVVA